ncbi:hypothetical protein [Sphingomonas sp. Mn802worker]|uniref:hypothetical protein n=1 Tax=Sphingomonas sp. Mn802worker TaxID=629773 RepID=UPI00039CBD82|nr:hypothetical protein [Sphingomonas sp. Mn802worker]
MGGHQVTSHGSGDDGFDEDGYDESQRAEILEATRDGPSDGTIMTDINPDLGVEEDDEDMESADDLQMTDSEVGVQDDEADEDEDDIAEDEAQDDFDDNTLAEDGDLDDGQDKALRP